MNIDDPTRSFSPDAVNISLLQQRAFNLRWAEVDTDVIPLTAADPDFPVATEILESINAHVADGILGYGPTRGMLGFREAVSKRMEERQVPSSPDQIQAADGAASALWAACRAVLGPGDEAITFDPVDFLLPHCSEQAGATVVRCPLERGSGAIAQDVLEQKISDRTRAILICNPHNPTGRVLRVEELQRIARLAVDNDLVIISDEIWADIVLGDIQMTSIASLSDEVAQRTITVSGFSKTYGLAGLRIGFIHSGSGELADRVLEASGAPRTIFGASVLSQVAAEAALSRCDGWRDGFIEHLKRMSRFAAPRLDALDGFCCPQPEGTYLLFPDIVETGMDANDLAAEILEQARVAVVPGDERWFGPGAKGHLRISFATSEAILDEAITRIERWNRNR